MALVRLNRIVLLMLVFVVAMMMFFVFQVSLLPTNSGSHPHVQNHMTNVKLGKIETLKPLLRSDTRNQMENVVDHNSRIESRPIATHTEPKMKVAFAITVTMDGPYLDGAAVLMQSVINTNPNLDYEFVALVHPGVVTTRPGLKSLGFKIFEFDPPVNSQDIKGKYLRDVIDKTGCCGALELLKLCAYKLTQYERVLLLDLDSMLVKNIDELFLEKSVGKSCLYTYDYAMDSGSSAAPPVQGGFLLVKPDEKVYQEIVDIVLEGDFRQGTGWGGSKIGWCWGGQTIQGVVSYYYNKVAQPGQGLELDHCEYNSMATTTECRHMDWERVKSIHFTFCQKPWECHKGMKPICEHMHTHWWNMRKQFEESHSLTPGPRCCKDRSVCESRTYDHIRLDLI